MEVEENIEQSKHLCSEQLRLSGHKTSGEPCGRQTESETTEINLTHADAGSDAFPKEVLAANEKDEELMPDQKIIHGDGDIPDTSFDEFDRESTRPSPTPLASSCDLLTETESDNFYPDINCQDENLYM